MFQVVNYVSSPKEVTNVVNNLNEKQKEDVIEIGFGSLLDLKLTDIDRRLYTLIHSQYDSMVITLHDKSVIHANNLFYHEVLGLPCKGVKSGKQAFKGYDVLNTKMEKDEIKRVKTEWRRIFDILDTDRNFVSQETMKERLLAETEGGEFFKKLFVMFVMTSFLAAAPNKDLVLAIAPALEDTSEIINYDWCSFIAKVVDANAKKVRDFVRKRETIKQTGTQKEREAEEQKEKTKKGTVKLLIKAGGCFPALMIGYIHRYVFGQLPSEDKPYIINWTNQLLRERIKQQLDRQNVGTARVVLQQTSPMSIKPIDEEEDEEVELVNAEDVSLHTALMSMLFTLIYLFLNLICL